MISCADEGFVSYRPFCGHTLQVSCLYIIIKMSFFNAFYGIVDIYEYDMLMSAKMNLVLDAKS